MADRRRHNRYREPERDRNLIATPRVHRAFTTTYYSRPTLPSLSLFEDRRTFDPQYDFRPARTLNRRVASQIIEVGRPVRVARQSVRVSGGFARSGSSGRAARPRVSGSFSRSHFQFNIPSHVAVCVRRKQRREVLFAKRATGKGSRSRKHRNYWSNVSCGRSSGR